MQRGKLCIKIYTIFSKVILAVKSGLKYNYNMKKKTNKAGYERRMVYVIH